MSATSAALRPPPRSGVVWRQVLASAAVLVLAVGAVTGAIALRGTQPGTSATVEFRAGPSPDVRTLDAAGFAFEFPAAWHAYDSSTNYPSLSSIAVLGTRPVEARCGDERHVEVTCVNERLLEAGEVRMNVGTGTYFGGSFRERPSITSGRTVRLDIGGQVAILDDLNADRDDYYGATESLHLYIEQPDKPNEIVLIDLIARGGGSDEVMEVMQQVIDTFRFDAAASPRPSAPAVAETSSPDPEPTEPFPESALGIPVISVPELIARQRSEPPSPEEVAVRGWMVRSDVVYDCAIPDIEPHPLAPRCLTPTFLMERPERPTELTTDRPSVIPLLGLDSHVHVDIGHEDPVDVVLIGHVGDHRWATCQPAEQDACRRVLVADRIVPVDASMEGMPEPWRIPRSASTDPGVDPEDVVARVEAVLGEITVVSIGHVAAGLLAGIEPALRDRGDIDLVIQEHPVWVVRALVREDPDPGEMGTFIVADLPVEDRALPIWEASEDGLAPLSERESSLRWPPQTADVVDLPFEVGAGQPPVQVAVIDETRHLVGARAATTAETALRDISMRAVWADDLPDGGVLVQWGGTMCDDLLTLRISASDAGSPHPLTVDGRRASSCRLVLRHYAIVLTFDIPVSASDLFGRYFIGP